MSEIRFIMRRQNNLDLRKVKIVKDTTHILLDHIKTLSGLDRLAELSNLQSLIMIHCGSHEVTKKISTLELCQLHLLECDTDLMSWVLKTCQPVFLKIHYLGPPVVDLSLIKHSKHLEILRVWSSMIRGADNLSTAPLKDIWFRNIAVDRGLRRMLDGCADTLERLTLSNETAFGPERLPELTRLSKLQQLTVETSLEFRSLWRDFAATHPGIDCKFPPVPGAVTTGRARLVEVYRGAPIIYLAKVKKYEIYGNVAGDTLNLDVSNHKLADFLKPAVTRQKKRLDITSSTDELTLSGKKIEDLRWAIDQFWEISPKLGR